MDWYRDSAVEIPCLRTDRGKESGCVIKAFYSNVYSSRLIDPHGVWKLNIVEADDVTQLSLTHEQRHQLIDALGGVMPEWTQTDEDAHVARKSGRDWHLALKPEDV